MNKEKKRAVLMTEDEVMWLAWILRHYGDYIWGDDRPDHGWGLLKEMRDAPEDQKRKISELMGKFNRLDRKWRFR